MPSFETETVRATWNEMLVALAPPAGISDFREGYEALCAEFPIRDDATFEKVDANGTPSVLVRTEGAADDVTVVWAHSGGYVFGSAHGYRAFAAEISAAAGVRVLLPDYRLAPENAYPAAHDDFQNAYQYLLDSGHDPAKVVLAGDSAGGGVAAGSLLRIKDTGVPLPAGLVLVSPFVDFTFAGESMASRQELDPIGSRAMLEALGGLYLGCESAENPYLSPVLGDWAGAPPVLALVGSDEVLHDDAVRLVERTHAAGGDARLVIGEGQFHIWPLFSHFLPEARDAVATIGQFVRSVVA